MSGTECTISLIRGRAVRLRLLDEDDLSSFVHRAVARLVADDPETVLGRLPLALLVLADNVPGSPRLGEAIATTQELADAAAAAAGEGSEPCFTLAARAAEEATCGVRRCREGLTHRGCLKGNGREYDSTYPAAFMVLTGIGTIYEDKPSRFPEFTGISVNMMPFVTGDVGTLPEYLHGYLPLIEACVEDQADEDGKIWYLTVDEKEITEDQTTHRRGGLHTDSPGAHLPGMAPSAVAPALRRDRPGAYRERNPPLPEASPPLPTGPTRRLPEAPPPEFHPRGLGTCDVQYHGWGIGIVQNDDRHGGIYLASNVDDSTEVFNAVVEDPRMIGHLGSCEHLREFLGESTWLLADDLCWLTDRTPHESLPLPAGTRRQFFRLVASQVGVWYADHSTANPTGVVPDPKITRVVHGSKFARERAAE